MSLRTGYTTGSCATAAAKAAAIGLMRGNIPDEIDISTPIGIQLKLNIIQKYLSSGASECAVRKDAGDDPDVTNGCIVHARLERGKAMTIEIEGGAGVGRVTKPGLQIPVGHAAINPVPRRMIEEAVREVTGNSTGIKVIISVPEGKSLGEKTFNPKLGIIGGISIIGTTGIVRPMSDDAFKTSLLCGLDIAKGMGFETVVLVPGSLGERSLLKNIHIPREQVVQISNFIGFMLDASKERSFKKVILAGHPGKLVKLLRGDFYTHSSVSKPANDIILKIIQQKGLSNKLFHNAKELSTIEGIIELFRETNTLDVMKDVAERIETAVITYTQNAFTVGVILFDMKGSIIGISDNAQTWLNKTQTR
ncbi:MAG: cobalt-precorrin-5B (C(1))-methyltransferase CbiD [Candidatus Brocadiaceae bacterium]|nr:cobalt-precorrin-5B (C(1))-methyltransferase CbiD [Candidatus Brocadiaceae bacterium]